MVMCDMLELDQIQYHLFHPTLSASTLTSVNRFNVMKLKTSQKRWKRVMRCDHAISNATPPLIRSNSIRLL